MTECSICTEKYNKTFRKPVSCLNCTDICCSVCFHIFLTTSQNFDPSCMFCNKKLTMDFVRENLSRKKFDEYSQYQFNMIFNRELSLLPNTQVIVNRIIKTMKIQKYLDSLTSQQCNKRRELKKTRILLKSSRKDAELIKIKKKLKEDLAELKILINECLNSLYIIRNNLEDNEEDTRPKFIMKCPDENCKGYLSSSYKCGTCSNYFCTDCHVKKKDRNDNSHVCDEDTKSTISLLKLDTKPCPKCMAPIHKINGCDQMWCLMCKTAFSWNTGKIEEGYIHNPEYFRYMRENGMNIDRNPNDGVCNQIPQYYTIITSLRYTDRMDIIDKWYTVLTHIKHYEMRNLPNNLNIDYIDFRIDYLMDKITQDAWKKDLKALIKKNEKNHEIYQVYDLFCQVISENFNVLIDDKDIDNFEENSNKIMEYCNNALININKKYKSVDKRFFIKV